MRRHYVLRCSRCKSWSGSAFFCPVWYPILIMYTGRRIREDLLAAGWSRRTHWSNITQPWKHISCAFVSIMIFGACSNCSIQYALTAMQNLMELDYGWSNLEDSFISTVVNILSSPQSLINVCRPATAILKKLVEADPRSAPGPIMPSSSTRPPDAPPGMYT